MSPYPLKLIVMLSLLAFSLSPLYTSSVVQASSSKSAASQAKITHVHQQYFQNQKFLKYPQITGLKSRTVQTKINQTFFSHIASSYKAYLQIRAAEKKDKSKIAPYEFNTFFKVKYHTPTLLSILFYEYRYTGGDHGGLSVVSYNFDLRSGKQMKLSDLLKGRFNKVQEYCLDYMEKHEGYFFDSKMLNSFSLSPDTSFYFTDSGIALIFQEYEVAPYAAGNPVINIPASLYK